MGGDAQIAAAVRDALIHDAVLLARYLAHGGNSWPACGGAVHGAAVGVGVLASYLAALGVSIALWPALLDRRLNALVPLVSFAVLALCGVRISLPASKPVVSPTGKLRCAVGAIRAGAVAPLAALGGGIRRWPGAGCQEGSFSVLSQIGTVVVSVWVLITVQLERGFRPRQGGVDRLFETHATLGWPTTITHRRHHTW